MKKKELPKPRNEFVVAMRLRPSGAHGKTKKAVRKADKQKLKKDIENE